MPATVKRSLPNFVHDCAPCVFLGSEAEYDFYYCANAELDMGGSIIARFGSDGPEYASCTVQIIRLRLASARAAGDAVPNGPTVRGLRLAEQRGIVAPVAAKPQATTSAVARADCPGCSDCVESWE